MQCEGPRLGLAIAIQRVGVLTLPVQLGCLFGLLGGCERQASSTVDCSPGYLEVYELSTKRSKTASTAIVDAQGTTWYRANSPLLDLRHFDTKQSYVTRVGDQRFVNLTIQHSERTRIYRWSKDSIGTTIGIVVNGELVFADKLVTTLQSSVGFPVASQKIAESFAKKFENCGTVDSGS